MIVLRVRAGDRAPIDGLQVFITLPTRTGSIAGSPLLDPTDPCEFAREINNDGM
jgi:hypothetical protein